MRNGPRTVTKGGRSLESRERVPCLKSRDFVKEGVKFSELCRQMRRGWAGRRREGSAQASDLDKSVVDAVSV